MQQGFRVLLRSIRFALVIVIALGLRRRRRKAQDGNLLHDGGFEGTYTNRGRADLDLPADWSMWFAESPHAEDWMNLPPGAAPTAGTQPSPHGGAQSLAVNKSYATFTAAVYQQVSVDPDTNVSASAFAFLRTCKIPSGANSLHLDQRLERLQRASASIPTAAPIPLTPTWSGRRMPRRMKQWQQMTVDATSTGSTVTLFLYSTQQWPYQSTRFTGTMPCSALAGRGARRSAPGAPTPQPTDDEQPAIQRAGRPRRSIGRNAGQHRLFVRQDARRTAGDQQHRRPAHHPDRAGDHHLAAADADPDALAGRLRTDARGDDADAAPGDSGRRARAGDHGHGGGGSPTRLIRRWQRRRSA